MTLRIAGSFIGRPRLPSVANHDADVQALNPLGYWKGDEISGTWADQEGVQDGTINNGPLLQADTIVDGDSSGQAATFNGVDQFVAIPHTAALKPAAGALILTFQFRLLPNKPILLAADENNAAGGLILEVLNDGSPRTSLRDSGGVKQSLTSTAAIELERAYAFAVTWGAAGFKGFLWDDSETLLWSDAAAGVTDGLAGTSEFRVGAWHTGIDFADGIISRIALFGSQLSQAQLATIAKPLTIAGGELPTEPSPPP